MNTHKNPAEAFVAQHCGGTFLSLWGIPNPIGKNASKELCDYLVVCGPDVLIVSVKEIGLATNPTKEEADRWGRKAIEESVKQIAGAERHIAQRTSLSDRAGRGASSARAICIRRILQRHANPSRLSQRRSGSPSIYVWLIVQNDAQQ